MADDDANAGDSGWMTANNTSETDISEEDQKTAYMAFREKSLEILRAWKPELGTV